jgi:hypothetical protein
MPRILLILVCCLPVTFSFSQSPLATDSTVKVLPHWKTNESHNVKITAATEEFNEGKKDKSVTRFDAYFTVQAKDSSGYTIEWIYKKADLASNEINLENIVLANLLNQKIIFRLSLTGRFKELINYEDLQLAFDRIIDKLILGSKNNPVKNLGFMGAKQTLNNKKSIEIALLKQIKFYLLSFGFKYKTNFTQTNQLQFPNAIGGKPFDATENVRLTKLDTLSAICLIERTSKMNDPAALKNSVFIYLQKTENLDSAVIDRKFGNEIFEFTEKSQQELNYEKGIPIKSNFVRAVNFGFEKRNSDLEIITID